jgi:hypothetical protein
MSTSPSFQKTNYLHNMAPSVDLRDIIRLQMGASERTCQRLCPVRPLAKGDERSRSYAWKICATSISFFVTGVNNSASGVCGSTLQRLRLESRGLVLVHS